MLTWRRAGFALVVLWFFMGGIGHFLWPEAYTSVVPSWVPSPREVVLLTGLCDVAGALGILWAPTRRFASYALMLYCVCVTPVHIEMLRRAERFSTMPLGVLWARLLFQPALVWIIWRCVVTPPPRVER